MPKHIIKVIQKLRTDKYEDDNQINFIKKDITLDERYSVWQNICKKNCRNTTKESYAIHYRRIQVDLGRSKLTSLNLIIIQEALNKLDSDNERKILENIVDMLIKL